MVLPRQPRSGLSTHLQIWGHAFIRLLFKLMLADIVCSMVVEWMIYLLFGRKLISKPNRGGGSGLHVIICGISQSGSTTLKDAMDILGFPCFHGANLFNPTTASLLMKADKSGNKEDWDHVLVGYTAIADFPAARCYKQLLKLYPDAKVILNIRDPERWYKSFSQTLLKPVPMIEMLRPRKIRTCGGELLLKGMLKGKEEDKEFAMQMYKQHIEEVKAHVQPSSKLLVYKFGEDTRGWAPLCEFLGKEVPQVPFPSANDSRSFQKFISYSINIQYLVIASYFALLFLIVSVLLKHLV